MPSYLLQFKAAIHFFKVGRIFMKEIHFISEAVSNLFVFFLFFKKMNKKKEF